MKVIAEVPDGFFNLSLPPEIEALVKASWRLVREGDTYELRVSMQLPEQAARKVRKALAGIHPEGAIPEGEAFEG